MNIVDITKKVNFINKEGLRTGEFYKNATHKFHKEPFKSIIEAVNNTVYFCVSVNGCRYLIDLTTQLSYKVSDYSPNSYFYEVNHELLIKD